MKVVWSAFNVLLVLSIAWIPLANSVVNKWSLDEHTMNFDSSTQSYLVEIGNTLNFNIKLKATEDIDDDLVLEVSAAHNGYSVMLFCGAPEIRTTDDGNMPQLMGKTYDSTYANKLFDSYLLDFGRVVVTAGYEIEISYSVFVGPNSLYNAAETYWMGVAVEMDSANLIWVSDIGFTLAQLADLGQLDVSFKESDPVYTYIPDGPQSNLITIVDPLLELGFRVEVSLIEPHDELCICNVVLFSVAISFQTCSDTSVPPHLKVLTEPPFNDTMCKKKFEVDYGILAKMNLAFATIYDEVVVEVVMCASENAAVATDYSFKFLLDTSAIPGSTNLDKTFTVSRMDLNTLPSVNCDIDVVYNEWAVGNYLSVTASVHPAPYDYGTSYKLRHTLTIEGCSDYPNPIVDVEPRLAMKGRHVHFIEEIKFTNESGVLVAEYDKILVSKKHATLYTEQENFDFLLDFKGKFAVSQSQCSDLKVTSEIMYVQSSVTLSQCLRTIDIGTHPSSYQKCDKSPKYKMQDSQIDEERRIDVHGNTASKIALSLTVDKSCNTTVLKDFTLQVLVDQLDINYPSYISIDKIQLAHVGDNFPGLQSRLQKDPESFLLTKSSFDGTTFAYENPQLVLREDFNNGGRYFVTSSNYMMGTVGGKIDFGDLEYFALNKRDIFDRQIVFNVEFFLLNSPKLDAFWSNNIQFTFSKRNSTDEANFDTWQRTVQVSVRVDLETTEPTFPSFDGNFVS